MAIMNLLRADWTGSLGQMTGVRTRGKSVLKTKIDGRAPLTAEQTQNLRRFEDLNRLACFMARHWGILLTPKSWHGLKHNWFAHHWKMIMGDPYPNWQALITHVGHSDWNELKDAAYDRSSYNIGCTFDPGGPNPPPGQSMDVVFFWEHGGRFAGPYDYNGVSTTLDCEVPFLMEFPVWGIHITISIEKGVGVPWSISEADAWEV